MAVWPVCSSSPSVGSSASLPTIYSRPTSTPISVLQRISQTGPIDFDGWPYRAQFSRRSLGVG